MPITVVSPANDVFGPGVRLNLHTDLVGPIGSDWLWHVTVYPHGDESNGCVFIDSPIWSVDQHQVQLQFGVELHPDQVTDYGTQVSLSTNELVDLVFELSTPAGVVQDSGALSSVKWDTDASASLTLPTTGGDALTTEQAQQLADDHASINPPLIAQDGTPITGAVGDTIVRPALKFLGIDTTAYTLTGQGTLDTPNILGVQTGWGIVLDVLEYPPGTSFIDGYVRSFHPRAAQFLLLWPAKNTAEAMVLDELRLHLEHRTWAWDYANVIAVAYHITPGWTVQLRFVTAFFP